MLRSAFGFLLASFALCLCAFAQPNDSLSTDPQKVYKLFLVAVDCKSPDSVEKAYTTRFDTKKVEMKYIFEDTINNLEDISFGEDPIEGQDCFIPEMKIVFYRATYIISFYCSEVRKYKNSGPWVTSSIRIKNDLPFTQSIYDYLLALRNKQLGTAKVSEAIIAKLAKPEALDDPADDMKELEQALNQEDDDKDDEDDVAKDNNFDKKLDGEDDIATDKPEDDELDPKSEDEDVETNGIAPSTAPKPATPPANGTKPAETKPADPKATTTTTTTPAPKPAETPAKPAETKPADPKTTTTPAETPAKPAETKPADPKTTTTPTPKPAETPAKPAETKPADPKTTPAPAPKPKS